ncbi:armadillo-type protein [Cercophora scortea]|uniref:Nucleolar protein 9 n=1 Tax=Cercophora scortea TaxID=314031 RepID=A0AAE0I736_9PEZI|nr:armadillo-type protein [Cercophora scortea]
MGKNRKSKRQLVRDEKRAKKRGNEVEEEEERDAKRQRRNDDTAAADLDVNEIGNEYIPLDDEDDENAPHKLPRHGFEREFFGMLADEEQEYFRRADELLELNDFPTPEERDIFLQNVYTEAKGKEMKLASSQSCSRLMERLILLSNTRQKKQIFAAFATHFISLVTHRFASHCCEKLFLQSASVVTQELGGLVEPAPEPEAGEVDEETAAILATSMEDMFLGTLDELEGHLTHLLSDRYGSHALRALLFILAGRPLNQISTKSLLQGKGKEYVTVEGASAIANHGLNNQLRAVPSSFTEAVRKIITDSTVNMDSTALRVLAAHPTGNPTLQLLLELELSLFPKAKKAPKAKKGEEPIVPAEPEIPEVTTLLEKLVPGAPATFSDETSEATGFVNSMLYDPIGSRLLETLVKYCPGKIFKGLQAVFFGPRIATLLRNDIASYPAIQVLNRLSKEDLADAVEKALPAMPVFVEKGRFNVIKTLFERCHVRGATDQMKPLLNALVAANGGDWKFLVPKLCFLDDETDAAKAPKEKFTQPDGKNTNKPALISHGSQLISALLSIPGVPAKAIQASLLALNRDQLLRLATHSAATAGILVKAFSTPSQNANFHKMLVAALQPHVVALTTSQYGHVVLNAIINAPSKGEIAVPFHLKENIMGQLEGQEAALRETWIGRNVWRTWKGDLWKNKRHAWVRWAKDVNPEESRMSVAPKSRKGVVVAGEKKGAVAAVAVGEGDGDMEMDGAK